MKLGLETLAGERHQTIAELSGLLCVVQEMGRRLSEETHGEAYDLIRKLNNLLHQARSTMILIQQAA